MQSRSLDMKRDKAVRQFQEQQVNEQQHIRHAVNQATAEKDKTIRLLQSTLKASRHIQACLRIYSTRQARFSGEP